MDIKNIISKIKNPFSKNSCYERMKARGYIEEDEKCYGMVGGTRATNYLSEECISCPHWKPIEYDWR